MPCGNVTGASSCTIPDYVQLADNAPDVLWFEVLALTMLLAGLWGRLICEAMKALTDSEETEDGGAVVFLVGICWFVIFISSVHIDADAYRVLRDLVVLLPFCLWLIANRRNDQPQTDNGLDWDQLVD